MNAANYITVTEFQNMNPEVDFSNYNDTTISGMIKSASAGMDNFLNYSLGIETITDEKNEAIVDSEGNLRVFVRKMPVQSVSALQLKLGTVSLDLQLTTGGTDRYEIPTRGSYVLYPFQEVALTGTFSVRNFYQMRGRTIYTKMTYVAGYATIPQDIKDACNLWTKDIFIRQANPMDIKGTNQGAIGMSFKDDKESKWLTQAKEILFKYQGVTA